MTSLMACKYKSVCVGVYKYTTGLIVPWMHLVLQCVIEIETPRFFLLLLCSFSHSASRIKHLQPNDST